jgi:hypothetical protein
VNNSLIGKSAVLRQYQLASAKLQNRSLAYFGTLTLLFLNPAPIAAA